MKKLEFVATREQYSELEGLAYWNANLSALKERDPDNVHDRDRYGKAICLIFDRLDRQGVPYWVQNSALAAGEDWRQYLLSGVSKLLERKGIVLA